MIRPALGDDPRGSKGRTMSRHRLLAVLLASTLVLGGLLALPGGAASAAPVPCTSSWTKTPVDWPASNNFESAVLRGIAMVSPTNGYAVGYYFDGIAQKT